MNDHHLKRTPYRKKNTSSKSQHKSTKLPPFMNPTLIQTASGNNGFHEEGGIIECGNTIKGFAKLLCSHDGGKKKPIYIFKKRSFKKSSHKKSMVLYTMKGDYIISFAFRSTQNNIHGIISLGIYRVFKQKSTTKTSHGSVKGQLQYTLYTRLIYAKVSRIINASNLDTELTTQYPKTKFGPNPALYQLFENDIEGKHLSFLKPVINAAIEKAISFETTYMWYHPHSEKFVDEMRNAYAI